MLTSDLCLSLSDLMGALSHTLNLTEQTVVQVEDLDSAAGTKLDTVMSAAQKLEGTVQELLDQVEFIKNSDIRGKGLKVTVKIGGRGSTKIGSRGISEFK